MYYVPLTEMETRNRIYTRAHAQKEVKTNPNRTGITRVTGGGETTETRRRRGRRKYSEQRTESTTDPSVREVIPLRVPRV